MPKRKLKSSTRNCGSSPPQKRAKAIVDAFKKSSGKLVLPAFMFSTNILANAKKELKQKLPLEKSYCDAIAILGQSLNPDDPGLFVAFRTPRKVHDLMGQSPLGGRPFARGADEQTTFQNLIDWITGKAGESGVVKQVGPHALSIGNLSQEACGLLCVSLICAKNNCQPWATWFLQNDRSLGGLVSVTGTDPGLATMCVVSSNVFRDAEDEDDMDENE